MLSVVSIREASQNDLHVLEAGIFGGDEGSDAGHDCEQSNLLEVRRLARHVWTRNEEEGSVFVGKGIVRDNVVCTSNAGQEGMYAFSDGDLAGELQSEETKCQQR